MDVKDIIHAMIRIENDRPIIRWHPALNDTELNKGVRTGVRTCRVKGANALGGAWTEVSPGNEHKTTGFSRPRSRCRER